jgi:hypothetical protein
LISPNKSIFKKNPVTPQNAIHLLRLISTTI